MRVPDDEAMQTTRNLHAGVPCGVSRASVRGNPKRRASQLVIVRAQEHTMQLRSWPVVRQLLGDDHRGLGAAVQSPRSAQLTPRIAGAEVVQSVCPYCAVGCGQRVFVKDGEIIQIEGDPDSPISRGRLCPKGAATRQLVSGPGREYKVKYRRPYGTEWEDLPLDR